MSAQPLRIRCRTVDEARREVALLLSRGVAPEDIEVLSAEPIHELGELLSRRSRLSVFAVVGAIVGAGAGYAMASLTALAYPLNTGGMPIVSQPPIGIVTYETMMLMAILFTLAGLLLEAKLPRAQLPEYRSHASAIVDGEIHILARMDPRKSNIDD